MLLTTFLAVAIFVLNVVLEEGFTVVTFWVPEINQSKLLQVYIPQRQFALCEITLHLTALSCDVM